MSLVELMMVLVVMGVMLAWGVPMFQDTMKNNRMAGELSALRSTLTNARSEATARRMPARMCSSSNLTACSGSTDWSNGYIVFADENNPGVLDAGEDIFIALAVEVPTSVSITFFDNTGTAADATGFTSRGDSLATSGTFVICDDRGAENARALILGPSGLVRAATDVDGDGTVNFGGGGGGNVSC